MNADRQVSGFYCSTSGTVFADKEAYLEHMKSDFHRYNLKRKVAGLPPVTKEWFEARKQQLASAGAATNGAGVGVSKLWLDPLSKKKFSSENTYLAWVRSKKYLELLKKSGGPTPEPLIILKSEDSHPESLSQGPSSKVLRSFKAKEGKGKLGTMNEVDDCNSGWETASDNEEDGQVTNNEQSGHCDNEDENMEQWEQWDMKRSFFDNHISQDMASNLDYMFRNFGFYFPDAEYLTDPEGLIKYLGAKLQYGHVPLYTKGDDENAKQFRSLHAVQRHMVDTNQCRMVYEDNEDEYAQFYEYEEGEEEGKDLIVQDIPDAMVMGGFELMLPGGDGQGGKYLGTREFARYYRQRHRLEDTRQSVVVNTVLSRYRSLGIDLVEGAKSLEAKKMTSKSVKDVQWEGKRNVRTMVWSNFVKQLGKGVGREY